MNTIHGRWSKKYDACIECGSTDLVGSRSHVAKGLCKNDYIKRFRETQTYRDSLNARLERLKLQPKPKKAKRKYWSRKWRIDWCSSCGSNDFRHKGLTLCTSCYAKQPYIAIAYRNYQNSEKGKQTFQQYYLKNKEKFREKNRKQYQKRKEVKNGYSN